MKKILLTLAITVAIFAALLCIFPVKAIEVWEASDRDPITGYSSAPGQSWSYAYLYAHYNPYTNKFSSIVANHNYAWISGTGQYSPSVYEEYDPNGPWCYTAVLFNNNGEWIIDTQAYVSFA